MIRNKVKIKSAVVGYIILFILVPALTAQHTFVDISTGAGQADYLLGSRLVPQASFMSSAGTLSHELSDLTRAYLDISHFHIYPDEDFSSSTAELGLQFRYLEIQDNQLFGGIFMYLNDYRETYAYYNSTGLGAYVMWKHYFKPNLLTSAGYDITSVRFSEVEEASNAEHILYLRYNQSFRSKTSLELKAEMSYQDFWAHSIYVPMGRRYYSISTEEIQTNKLLSPSLRISQSLGQYLGITLRTTAQSLLNNRVDSLQLQDGLNNPFIDRFRWEGSETSLNLSVKPNWENTIQLSYDYSIRDYVTVPVYEFDFSSMDYVLDNEEKVSLGFDRSDITQSVGLEWKRSMSFFNFNFLSGIDFSLAATYRQSNSNDPLYDFEGMQYQFNLILNN